MGATEFGGERVAISAAWTACDAGRVATRKLGGGFPGSIVGHRTFDREDAAMVVGVCNQPQMEGRRVAIGRPLTLLLVSRPSIQTRLPTYIVSSQS